MTAHYEALESIRRGSYIDGQWREPTTGPTFIVENPADGSALCEVHDGGSEEWTAALDAAAASEDRWRASTPKERSEILHGVYRAAHQRKDELATVLSLESGKPYKESLAEIDYGSEFLRWYSELILSQQGEIGLTPSGEYQMITVRESVGPALLITPWNFPFAMVTRKVGAAVAAGCTSLIKPAYSTPLTCAFLVELFEDNGLPAGVLNYVPTTDSRNMSQQIMSDFRLRKISFTGSTAVGAKLLEQAAPNIQAASMELGGNAPFLVLPDADLEEAINGAVIAKFRNAGQACVAANRIIAHQDVYEDFVEGFLERVKTLKIGAWDESPDMGPLIDAAQRDRVTDLLRRAEPDGGTRLWGGESLEGPGHFMEPTVIRDVPVGGTLWREEIFGPVAPVYRAESLDEMLQSANDTEYGLVSYLYGNDAGVLDRFTRGIRSGMVAVNRPVISEARSPFGGVKASGMGREGGRVGLDDYQTIKYIAVQRQQ